jgi:hypothetical protein
MGLIKTAMISGVGLYGINKLAKTAEHRQSSPSNYPPPRDYNNYPPQQGAGNWGPPPQGPRQGQAPREDAYYGENLAQQQRQWYPAQGPDGRARGYSADYEEEKYTNQDGEVLYQARERYTTPPPYGAQQGYQQQALPYEGQGRSSPSRTAALTDMAMQFVANQHEDGDKKGKKGKSGDLLSGFLSK